MNVKFAFSADNISSIVRSVADDKHLVPRVHTVTIPEKVSPRCNKFYAPLVGTITEDTDCLQDKVEKPKCSVSVRKSESRLGEISIFFSAVAVKKSFAEEFRIAAWSDTV